MSLALIIPDRPLQGFITALTAELPDVRLQIWPDIPAPDEVQMAVVWRHPAGSLTAFNQLKAIHSFGAGVDAVLADPALPSLPIARIVDPALTQAMVHYVHTVVAMYHLRMDLFLKQQSQSLWKPRSQRPLQHICVLGLGEIGGVVATHLAAQGYQVSGWAARPRQLDGIRTYAGEAEFAAAVGEADLVVCLLPLTDATRDFLNAERLAMFKTGSLLLNVARGAIVVDEDLLAALATGQLSGATLDVFRQEPLPVEYLFWQHPAIQIPPHISAVTNVVTAAQQIATNYRRLLAGQPLLQQIDTTRGY